MEAPLIPVRFAVYLLGLAVSLDEYWRPNE
jgi:hypothetical protein